jgi:hypothetical protein
MTKQYERTVNLETGETTDRELTEAEIAELANVKSVAEMQAEQLPTAP